MITPIGILSRPLNALRQMVANSASFQAWAGVASAAAALDRVHLFTSPIRAVMPFVLIDFGSFARERSTLTNRRGFQMRPGSDLLLYCRAEPMAGQDDQDAAIDYMNKLGAVWIELEQDAGRYEDETFSATEIEIINPPQRIPVEDRKRAGDFFECTLSLTMSRIP
jgi:hypothetical protein